MPRTRNATVKVASRKATNGHAPSASQAKAPPVDEATPNKGVAPEAHEDESDESHVDDPVRMYLMQMGEIPMLTRDEEVAAARQIESTRTRFRHSLLRNDFVLRGAVDLLEKVHRKELRLDRTIEISVTNTA